MIQKFYIRKLKLLPTNLSVDADPTKMLEAIKEEEADLSTPVQQKLLKRISGDVNPKREPVTPARKRGITPSVPIKKEAKKPKTTKTSTAAAEGTSTIHCRFRRKELDQISKVTHEGDTLKILYFLNNKKKQNIFCFYVLSPVVNMNIQGDGGGGGETP